MDSKDKKDKKKDDDSDDEYENWGKGLSEEEFNKNMEFFQTHPMFMKDIPQNFESNPNIQALQSIVYDEADPRTQADRMNKAGNQMIQKGNEKYYLREAFSNYSQALDIEFEDDELRARIHCNRALCNMKAKNYGRVMEDCRKAITLNPRFIKAYYRCAQALVQLDKFEEAEKVLEAALKIENDYEVGILLKTVKTKLEEQQKKKEQKKLEFDAKYQKLVAALKERNYTLGKKRIHQIPESYERDPFVDDDNVLNFATIVTYMEFGQMDIIQQTRETDNLEVHLKEIFKDRLPWDENNYYSYNDIVCYVELNCVDPMYKSSYHTNYEARYCKVSRSKPISNILKLNGYVMPFVLEVHVLSKKSPFYEKFLSEFDIKK